MLYTMAVHEAIKKSLNPVIKGDNQDTLISLLVHDIFGGEILKTPDKRGWHYYNRVDGLRLDFSRPEMNRSAGRRRFAHIPATPDETYNYFEMDEYSTFLTRFIRSFEEFFGLDKYNTSYSA
jgi:hypothetical protein